MDFNDMIDINPVLSRNLRYHNGSLQRLRGKCFSLIRAHAYFSFINMERKMKRIFSILCLLIFFCLAGCSTVTVTDETVGMLEVQQMKKYSWLAPQDRGGEVRSVKPEVEKLIVSAVEKYLAGKGLEKTAAEDADVFITWFGKVDDKVSRTSVAHFYRPYGYGTLAAQHPAVVEEGAPVKNWQEGTLILDIIDADSKAVVWRGSATDTIRGDMSADEIVVYINRSVKGLLDRLFSL